MFTQVFLYVKDKIPLTKITFYNDKIWSIVYVVCYIAHF